MGFVPNLPQTLMKDDEFVTDLARFAEGLYTEQAVRKKYRLDEGEWITLGEDDELVERIELEKTRRIRSGAAKREKAQQHVVKAPDVLDKILCDERASPKHRIDAAKTLDAFAGNGPEAAAEQDRFHITINLGGDTKLTFDKSLRVDPNDNSGEIIDQTPQELPPPRRGPGRPRGSKNRPKTVDPEELLPFIAANKRTTEGGNGNAL